MNFIEKGDIKRGVKRQETEFAEDFWSNFERGEYDLRTRSAKRPLRDSEKDSKNNKKA